MQNTLPGRPAGKTGPVAAAVVMCTLRDLAFPYHPAGTGAAWCIDARTTGGHKGRGHVLSVMADRAVEGRAA
jgi:hypothetical protein